MLGAGPGDAGGVGFLKGVVTDQVGWHLTANANDRHAVHHRIEQACHRVGGAGAGCHQDNADLAGGTGVAFRRMDRAPFLSHKNVADLVLLEKFVINRQDSAPRIAKDNVYALISQCFQEYLCAAHVVFRHRPGLYLKQSLGRHWAALVIILAWIVLGFPAIPLN